MSLLLHIYIYIYTLFPFCSFFLFLSSFISMSKKSSSHVNIWKHRIKGLLQKTPSLDDPPPPPPPPPPPSSVYTKSKPSSLIYRMFATRNKSKAIIQLKKHQWDGDLTQEETISNELPLRANLMSFFSASRHGGENWDDMSRLYMATLQKLRLLTHYSMEHQLVIHHILHHIQDTSLHLKNSNRNSLLNRDFSSLVSGQLMGNRKPRRTRYIFMLLSTPASHVTHRVHPVTDALHKLRKPYAETMLVVYPNEEEEEEEKEKEKAESVMMCRFVPAADYLLDPATFRDDFYHHEEEYRFGTEYSGNTTITTTTSSSREHQLKELMAAM
jgi:hypothetical protein